MTTTNEPRHVGEALGALGADLVPESFDAAAEFDREERERKDAAIEKRWTDAVPPRFAHARLDDLDPELEKDLVAWADNLGGGKEGNLVLLGPVGVGKTYAAIAVARYVFDKIRTQPRFVPVVELLDALRPGGKAEIDDYRGSALLVLDDLGAQKDSEWTAERLYAILNRKWLDRRPIVVTTNIPPEQLQSELGERIYSRLVHDAVAVRLTGKDRRRA